MRLECNDRPTEDDLDKGWTCQTYVDRGFDMVEYCSKQEWIDGKICGQTCSSYGIKTNPSCVMGNQNKPFSIKNLPVLLYHLMFLKKTISHL